MRDCDAIVEAEGEEEGSDGDDTSSDEELFDLEDNKRVRELLAKVIGPKNAAPAWARARLPGEEQHFTFLIDSFMRFVQDQTKTNKQCRSGIVRSNMPGEHTMDKTEWIRKFWRMGERSGRLGLPLRGKAKVRLVRLVIKKEARK